MHKEREPHKLISVIIPMYNAESVIGEQLEALAAQTYEGDWEVVVADNRSTDSSADVVRSYEDRIPALRLVEADERQGPGYARNVGSRGAQGDVILYADADDVVSPDWMAAMAAALAEHDFVAGWSDPDGFERPSHAPRPKPALQLPCSFGFLPWTVGGNCGVKAAVYAEVHGWNEEWPFGEDVDFSWRVQLAGYPLVYVPEAVVNYRPRPTLTAMAKQQFKFGTRSPLLLREFEAFGATRRPLADVVRNWLWIVTRVPYALIPNRRRTWVGNFAGSAGRIWGSVKWRKLSP